MKATLEAVTFQTRDILEAMALDCGYPLQKLLVDGGMTVNNMLMQMQADYCGIPVGKARNCVLKLHVINVILQLDL